jgi:hypothetical protein
MPGFEADDILGTICEELKADKETEIIIASGDMDTLQLVENKKVQVYTLKKGIKDTILYDEKAVIERFGFHPLLLPDFKGLRGDPSDNIIGVKGIGEKTATSLIVTFGTIEKIYKALKKEGEYKKAAITERVRDLLLENEEEALFSKTLATIRRDAPIEFMLPKPWKETLVMETLLELFRVLEFRTLGERIKMLIHAEKDEVKKTGEKKEKKIVVRKPEPVPMSDDEKDLCLALWVIDSNISYPTMEDVYAFTKTDDKEKAKSIIETELDKRGVRKVYEDIEKPLKPVVEQSSKDFHKSIIKNSRASKERSGNTQASSSTSTLRSSSARYCLPSSTSEKRGRRKLPQEDSLPKNRSSRS